jgi:hypothetical protein
MQHTVPLPARCGSSYDRAIPFRIAPQWEPFAKKSPRSSFWPKPNFTTSLADNMVAMHDDIGYLSEDEIRSQLAMARALSWRKMTPTGRTWLNERVRLLRAALADVTTTSDRPGA